MADADLGRIVGMIMENPELVERIKEMANGSDGNDGADTEPIKAESTPTIALPHRTSQRAELLHALSGFLSPERQRALESVTSVLGILDTMKTK